MGMCPLTRVLLPYQRARVMCRPLRRLRLMLLMPSNSVVALHAARWVCCRRLLCCLVSPCFHISSSRVQACIVGRKTDFATCVCCLLLAADGVGPCSGRVGLTWPIAGMPGEAGAVLFHLLLCSFLSIDMFSLK